MLRGAFLALVCLAACSPSGEATSDDAQSATLSAEGYGAIRIGMTPEEASDAFGHFLLADASPEPQTCETYMLPPEVEPVGMRFLALDGRLARITDLGSAGVATPEGIAVGATAEEVRAAYPNAVEEPAKYDPPPAHTLTAWVRPEESGIRFHINAEGRVTDITAGNASILLVEGCS